MSRIIATGLCFRQWGPIDLDVGPGECVAVMGPSGAGKTLLLRALVDLDPHEGDVRLNDIPCDETPPHQWRRWVGMLPAESAWWADTVGEHVAPDVDFGGYGFVPDVRSWEVSRLSTGEKQRLALARLLSRKPRCLLLDEPTASLDPDSVERIEKLLEAYRLEHDAPVLWVSHDRAQASRVASRVLTFDNGQLEESR